MPEAQLRTWTSSVETVVPASSTFTMFARVRNDGPSDVLGLSTQLNVTSAVPAAIVAVVWRAPRATITRTGTSLTSPITANLAVGQILEVQIDVTIADDTVSLSGTTFTLTAITTPPPGIVLPQPDLGSATIVTVGVVASGCSCDTPCMGDVCKAIAYPTAPPLPEYVPPAPNSYSAYGPGDTRPSDILALTGPCQPYVTIQDLKCRIGASWSKEPVSDAVLYEALLAATEVLFFATGQQYFGSCRDMIRPKCLDSCVNMFGTCGCSKIYGLDLSALSGKMHITRINRVIIDGEVLSLSAFQINDWRYLVQIPTPTYTPKRFPCSQRIDLPVSEKCTWEIDFNWGLPTPQMLIEATTMLAVEYAKLFSSWPCSLPANVVQAHRQGTVYKMVDIAMLNRGKLGMPYIDFVVSKLNPAGLQAPSFVFTPEMLETQVTRTTTRAS